MKDKHPLEIFRFCPVCGSKHFEVNNFKSKKCEDCGFTYYANPCAATAAIILKGQETGDKEPELLVVRRAKEPAKGTLDLPGGFVDMYETAEEGMRYQYSGMGVHTIDMDYMVRVKDDTELHAADDAAECLWIPLSQVNPDDFGLTSIRNAVIRFLQTYQKP